MRKVSSLFVIVFTVLSTIATCAQNKEGANWLFGGNIHMDFNSTQPAIDTFSFMAVDSMLKGVASISDRNGNLLFFTSNGYAVSRQKVNGFYQVMPNGAFYPRAFQKYTMAEMIVQSPADSNIYYLFFTTINYVNNGNYQELYQLRIDMRLNNGYGDVVPNSMQLLRNKASHYKLTAFLHANNRNIWVGNTNNTGDSIFAYLVTPSGIMPPVISKLSHRLHNTSRLKASPNSEMFVVGSNLGSGIEGVDIYDFNRTTGIASLKYSLPTPVFDYPFFSFAFSPNSNLLYTGTIGLVGFPKNAAVYQYNLTVGSNAQVEQSKNVIYNSTDTESVFDMQLAINGKIYLVIDSTYLSQINCPDAYGAACGFQVRGIKLPGRVNGGSLPTLNQTIFRNAGKLQAQATRNLICEGETVQLSAFGVGAEHFKWEAANGLVAPSDTLSSPFVSPTVTTTYKVTGRSACRTDTAFVKVSVVPNPGAVSIAGPVQVYESIKNQEYTIKNPNAGSTFNWQVNGGTLTEGQGQGRILVNWGEVGEGSVSVTEIGPTGCSSEDAILKVEIVNGPEPVIYNIITPNGDGKNDSFVIENLKWHAENELRIYNRWGTEVYKSMNYQNNWQAENLSGGVYYYYFRANGKSWKGWVEVVR